MDDPKGVIERHVAAWNAHDVEALPFRADAELLEPGVRARGRDEIHGLAHLYWGAFPDARLQVLRLLGEGSLVAVELRFTGTNTGVFRTPDAELPPTGRLVDFRAMELFEVRGDEIVSGHLYFDQNEFLTQLGMGAAPAEAAMKGT